MLKKNIATVIAGLIMSGSVYSANKLGMLKLNSTRHEPFSATITVRHEKGSDLKLMHAQLGSIVDFYRHNLEPSFLNSSLSFNVEDKNEQEKIIRITSELPLSTETFGFVVRLYDDEEKAFGVYRFIPPVVDPMENVELFVCNNLNWDKNKNCIQKVNTALGFEDYKEKKDTKIKIGKINSDSKALDDNSVLKFEMNKNESNTSIKNEEVKKGAVRKIQESPPIKKESKPHKSKPKPKITNRQNGNEEDKKLKAQTAAQAQAKKVDTAAKKRERSKLRRKLKPHMQQASKRGLPDYHSAEGVGGNLKPQISIQRHKEDTISKGVVKFSEILKVAPPEEKK